MKTFKNLLESLVACLKARDWAGDMTIEEVVKKCERGDWLLWLATKVNLEMQVITLAKVRCAKTVSHLMPDSESANFISVAEKFVLGEASLEDFNITHEAAYKVLFS